MKNSKKSSSRTVPRAATIFFVVFTLIALAAVVLLEFLDFRAGRYSLIFSKIVPLGRALKPSEKFDREWTEILVRGKVDFDFFTDREGLVHFKVKVADAGYLALARELHGLVEKYRGFSRLSEVQGMKEQTLYLYQIRFDRQLTHVILLNRLFAEPVENQAKPDATVAMIKPGAMAKKPRLAVIIDDVGYTDSLAEQLRDLDIPLTAAVIPSAPFAIDQAKRIHAYGLETIIHLPMQPLDPANHHPRGQFVLSDSSSDEIAALLNEAMAKVPHARGLNNHMGSLVTADLQAMERVLEQVKKAGLFFVDSKTTYETVAFALARKMQIKTAIRDVFLDDEQNYLYTSNQIRNLVELARKNGRALAIGHPFASTLAALRDAVPWLKQQKVELVFASALL